MDRRLQKLQSWVAAALSHDGATLSDIQASWCAVGGDASFRRYFRLRLSGRCFVVMDAPPPDEDVTPFIEIAERLRRADLRSPRIYAAQRQAGFLLLEDFSDEMLQRELDPAAGQALFDDILPLLSAMVTRVDSHGLPPYDASRLTAELALFGEWYLPYQRGLKPTVEQQQQWRELSQLLVGSALAQPQGFVHRDFHSCNLHRLDGGEIGIIDFQDALCGPVSYDLASWLWDRYISWPRAALEQWMCQSRPQLAPAMAEGDWIRCCDFMGLQRNLKIIGIFSRLHHRDNKSTYLELIPRFSAYVLDVLPRHVELTPYRPLLQQWLEVEASSQASPQ